MAGYPVEHQVRAYLLDGHAFREQGAQPQAWPRAPMVVSEARPLVAVLAAVEAL